MRKTAFWTAAAALALLTAFAPAATAQKAGTQAGPKPKPKADPVTPVLQKAKSELEAGHADAARRSFEEAFRLDSAHGNDEVNTGLAGLILDEQIRKGVAYDLTAEQLKQRFRQVPYLAQGFVQYHLGDKPGAERAWHNIIEWRGSDELVQYLNEMRLTSEITQLKSEMGIDSGTGIGAQQNLEKKYVQEQKWEGAFQLVRKRLLEIPVGSKAEQADAADKLTQKCVGYFFQQAAPKQGLRALAADLAQKTRDHQRVLRQILDTGQVPRTTLARVHPAAKAEQILRKRVESLERVAGYLDELAGNPEAPVGAEAVPEPPEESVAP